MKMFYPRKVLKLGKGTGITIPAQLVKALTIEVGSRIDVVFDTETKELKLEVVNEGKTIIGNFNDSLGE